MWATGKRQEALNHLLRAAEDQPGSGAVVGQIIEYAAASDDLELAKSCLVRFESVQRRTETSLPYLRYVAARTAVAEPRSDDGGYGDLLEAAILHKRARNDDEAHRMFESLYNRANDDPKVVQEFAQTKLALARAVHYRDVPTKKSSTDKRRSCCAEPYSWPIQPERLGAGSIWRGRWLGSANRTAMSSMRTCKRCH